MDFQKTGDRNILTNRHSSTVAFAVAILLFFLPFTHVKCNDTPVVVITGKNYMLGESGRVSKQMESFQESFNKRRNNRFDREAMDNSESPKGKVFFTAIAAFLIGVTGVALGFASVQSRAKIITILGLAGVLLMIVFMLQAKGWLNREMEASSTTNTDLSGMMKISIVFTPWYYLSLFSFFAAAYLGFKQQQRTISAPAAAPQVPIRNPGDQSDFPPAPTGEKDLG